MFVFRTKGSWPKAYRLIALLAEVASENYSIILLLSFFSTADTTYIALNIARNL